MAAPRLRHPDSHYAMVDCSLTEMTASRPGAIAILQLGGDIAPILAAMTGRSDWPIGCVRLASFADIDEGLAVRLTEDVAQLMPHGGPRTVQRLVECLDELGVTLPSAGLDHLETLYPEADDRCQALMLLALSRAVSPLAIDLLLDQPDRWSRGVSLTNEDSSRSARLDRLIHPPMVVVAGPANVGKSSLSNALMGRGMSITSELAGTTRDYTLGRINLGGLVVDWHDTPGIRPTDDPVESRAIELAARLMDRADLLIAMTDAEHDWPDLPRAPDLRLCGKTDLAQRHDADVHCSSMTGEGMADLVTAVRDRLVRPSDLAHPGPWLFDDRLLLPGVTDQR